MSFKLEDLPYQRRAIDSVIRLFDGQERNFFANVFADEVHSNVLTLTPEDIAANKRQILKDNYLNEGEAQLADEPDFCVEMETGTGRAWSWIVSNEDNFPLKKKSLRNDEDQEFPF